MVWSLVRTDIKAKLAFSWDNIAHRFRYGNGRYVSATTIENARQSLVDSLKIENEKLAQRLVDGKITVSQWEKEMRDNLRRVYTTQYLLGRGGINNMSQRDWGVLGHELRNQYSYLHTFASEIGTRYTDKNLAGLVNRMNLYASSTGWAFERAKAESYGIPTLPRYPRGGSTACVTNCKCYLDFETVTGGVNVTWRKTALESCADCKRLDGKTIKVRNGKITNSGVWG